MKDLNMSRLQLDPEDEVGSVTGYESDDNLVEPADLKRYFTKQCLAVTGKPISPNNYILHLDGTKASRPDVVVGLSDFTTEVHHISSGRITKIAKLDTETTSPLVRVKISPKNNQLVYTASTMGYISLWDLRTPAKRVCHFTDTTIEEGGRYKPILCFDVSYDDRVLTSGSEQFDGDAFIFFWDIRNVKLLGGYWESHTDDITNVIFHTKDRNKMMSASTDGLINMYDLSHNDENDALTESLNTESSVDKVAFHRQRDREVIACTTHTSDMQFWKIDDAEPFQRIDRSEITARLKRKSENYCYTIGSHMTAYKELFLLAGSNYTRDRCLRSLKLENNKFVPYFMCEENTQVVRSSWYGKYYNMLVTGGESGILNVWRLKL